MKIWCLFKHENLTTGNKIFCKRGEIAPLFHFIFNISLTSGVKLNEMWLFDFFSSSLQTDMSRYGYLEVFTFEFEITRVDYLNLSSMTWVNYAYIFKQIVDLLIIFSCLFYLMFILYISCQLRTPVYVCFPIKYSILFYILFIYISQ